MSTHSSSTTNHRYENITSSKARYFTQSHETAYFLPSDKEEAQRLKRQHELLTRKLGLIQAPVSLTKTDFVLESGTGTGIWLLELAKTHTAGINFFGIDIESRLFPDHSLTPLNVNFLVQSVLNLPEAWSNTFTLVHQRLLVCALRKAEWSQALQQIYRVLKPGGWVQLTEVDDWVAGPATKAVQTIFDKLGRARGTEGWPGLAPRLKNYLEKSGFNDVIVEYPCTPLGACAGEDGTEGRRNVESLICAIKSQVLEHGGFGVVDGSEKYDELLAEVLQEINSMQTAHIRWISVCARKSTVGGEEMKRDVGYITC